MALVAVELDDALPSPELAPLASPSSRRRRVLAVCEPTPLEPPLLALVVSDDDALAPGSRAQPAIAIASSRPRPLALRRRGTLCRTGNVVASIRAEAITARARAASSSPITRACSPRPSRSSCS
ncbi:MAG: hypothetical protein U0168_03445 [Nannocystaceae bacterium]